MDQLNVLSSIAASLHQPNKDLNPFAHKWLTTHYTVSKHTTIARTAVHASYSAACEEEGAKPLNAATFGKCIKSIFKDVKTRRLGTRGQSRYNYCGIAPSTVEETTRLARYGEISTAVPSTTTPIPGPSNLIRRQVARAGSQLVDEDEDEEPDEIVLESNKGTKRRAGSMNGSADEGEDRRRKKGKARAFNQAVVGGEDEGWGSLREVIPALRASSLLSPSTGFSDPNELAFGRLSRATILTSARDYIIYLIAEREKILKDKLEVEEFVKSLDGGEEGLRAWQQDAFGTNRQLPPPSDAPDPLTPSGNPTGSENDDDRPLEPTEFDPSPIDPDAPYDGHPLEIDEAYDPEPNTIPPDPLDPTSFHHLHPDEDEDDAERLDPEEDEHHHHHHHHLFDEQTSLLTHHLQTDHVLHEQPQTLQHEHTPYPPDEFATYADVEEGVRTPSSSTGQTGNGSDQADRSSISAFTLASIHPSLSESERFHHAQAHLLEGLSEDVALRVSEEEEAWRMKKIEESRARNREKQRLYRERQKLKMEELERTIRNMATVSSGSDVIQVTQVTQEDV